MLYAICFVIFIFAMAFAFVEISNKSRTILLIVAIVALVLSIVFFAIDVSDGGSGSSGGTKNKYQSGIDYYEKNKAFYDYIDQVD